MARPLKFNKLLGKRVLLIGGTSGIGFATAEGCLEHGADVVLSGSNEQNIQRAIDRLRDSYPSARDDQISGYACDLADTPNLENNIKSLLEKSTAAGKLDHIALTAGSPPSPLPLSELTVAHIPEGLSIRLYSALILAKLTPEYMKVSGDSSLTFTGGTITDKPRRDLSLLVSVGGALQALSRSLTLDLQPIRVNLVAPAFIITDKVRDRFSTPEALEAFLETSRKATTTGQLGRPEDVAEAYLYIMKDRTIAGETLKPNSGKLLV